MPQKKTHCCSVLKALVNIHVGILNCFTIFYTEYSLLMQSRYFIKMDKKALAVFKLFSGNKYAKAALESFVAMTYSTVSYFQFNIFIFETRASLQT